MNKKVFISYAAKNGTYANLLARTLRKKGIDAFTQNDSLTSGEEWEERIRKELEESNAVIALISDNWTQSNYAATEYGAAYVLGKKIIPVVIDEIKNEIPINIHRFLTVDAKNEDLDSVAHQVEEAL